MSSSNRLCTYYLCTVAMMYPTNLHVRSMAECGQLNSKAKLGLQLELTQYSVVPSYSLSFYEYCTER